MVVVFILLGDFNYLYDQSSMSILRSYCLFNEMRIHSKIYAENKDIQLVIELDKKSNYTLPID